MRQAQAKMLQCEALTRREQVSDTRDTRPIVNVLHKAPIVIKLPIHPAESACDIRDT